jgi:DNA-binding beta-propeller fold protein YncE
MLAQAEDTVERLDAGLVTSEVTECRSALTAISGEPKQTTRCRIAAKASASADGADVRPAPMRQTLAINRVRRMAMPSRRTRVWASASVTLALATAGLANGAQAAPPPVGMPVQLAPPNACYSTTAAGGCAAFGESRSISGAEPIAVSGDGLNVYAGGDNGGGAAFSRGAGGALSTLGGAGGFAGTSFAVNGAGLFVAFRDSGSNNGAVEANARGADGKLTFVNEVVDGCAIGKAHCEENNNGLYDVEGIAVAPNGERVYAASQNGGGGTGGALTVFSRNAATQAITQLQCVPQTLAAKSGLCHEGTAFAALEGAHSVAVSPDGKFLYATGYFAGSVMGFNIVQSGPNAGKIGSAVNCLWGGASGECAQTAGMSSPNGIALSADGRDVYVAMFNGGITALRRDPLSGVLSFNQCFTQGGGGGCAADAALVVGARDVVVSPDDGSHVYLSGGSGINGYLRVYARDGLTGMLNPLGCISYLAIPGCSTAAGMANADKLAISPDGHNLYLTAFEGGDGEGAVAAFRIQTAPSCQSTSVGVLAGSSASIPLACTDEGGDPIIRKIVTAPGKGTLGVIDQAAGTVTYTPAAGFTGSDSFAFQASDGTNESGPSSVSLTVTAPAPPPPGGSSPLTGPPLATPHSRILGLARRVLASKLNAFHGNASGGHPIARVEIALVRLLGGAHVSAAKRRSNARCLQLNGKGRLDALKVVRGRCAATHFLLAKGTSKWTFPLRRRLPPGSYVLVSRATDTSGKRESVFSASLGNRVSFTIR